jgi:prolyl-tRNA editing enzyme YbaK/EbsC (Cys-tRNA(Pro) deacylase)
MTSSIESLEQRIYQLECVRYQIPSEYTTSSSITDHDVNNSSTSNKKVIVIDDAMRRARRAVEQFSCFSAVWKFVPHDYYSWTLQQRADCLQATTIHSLCKSLLMENRKVPSYDDDNHNRDNNNGDQQKNDPTNPKYVMILLQYATTLDVKKLTNVIRTLRTNVKERLLETQFDWRIASYEDNLRITGYECGSVTPYGLLRPRDVTYIISSEVAKYPFVYMGGGHTQCKLGIAYDELITSLSSLQSSTNMVMVADISQPRSMRELQQGGLE